MKRNRARELKTLLPLFFSVVCLLVCANSYAESFTASVKLELIDPASLTAEQLLQFGTVKNIPDGQCTMNPANGELRGTTCTTAYAQPPQVNISGEKALAVSVYLSGTSSDAIHFDPSLFNGSNHQSNFKLSKNLHSVTLGGTLSQSSAFVKNISELNYDVEVVYP